MTMKVRASTFCMAVGVALVVTVAFAGVANKAPDSVVLDKAHAKRPHVTFPHKVHAATIACDTCHHTNKGLKATDTVEVATCASCHLDPEKPETGSIREMSLTKNPFHKLCIDCHKKEAKGPAKCNDCHKP